ncbi:MAG TPA: lysylphosphatidylglycerol synthase transmembrane domain-containing protein [Blastocatellia bacterium]|nr:lysylphosphatidylglycerol synthase transmembrane domain-containing protein [Blastocatellia bacterium]
MDQQDAALIEAAPQSEVSAGLFKRVAGYLLAAACLAWVFYDVQPARVAASFAAINWWWVALAVACDIASYVCQAWRWRLLLRPAGDVSLPLAIQAIYAGLFANEVLPMRLGEMVRAYLASRWAGVELAAILPSMIAERLLDGIWLALAIALTSLFIKLPKEIIEAGYVFAALSLMLLAGFIYVLRKKQNEDSRPHGKARLKWKPLRLVVTFIAQQSRGLRSIGASRQLYIALVATFFYLALQAVSLWLVMVAFGLRLSLFIGAAVFLIVHLGTAIPNAPANVGSYQFFCVVGLTLFGIEKSQAAAFSVAVFVLLTAPLWAIGFFALSRSGSTLYQIKREMGRLITGRASYG